MKSTIYLFRHGITEGNKKGWFYGALEVHLEPEGIEGIQTRAASGAYPDPEDAQIFTSGMIRTEETLLHMYGREIPHEQIPEFKERNYGVLEGLSWPEAKDLPLVKEYYADTTGDFVIPGGGETNNVFDGRVAEGWKKLVGLHHLKELSHRHSKLPATTIVVCHGGVIDRIIHNLFGSPDDQRFQWMIEPGHGYAIHFENGDPVGYELV